MRTVELETKPKESQGTQSSNQHEDEAANSTWRLPRG